MKRRSTTIPTKKDTDIYVPVSALEIRVQEIAVSSILEKNDWKGTTEDIKMIPEEVEEIERLTKIYVYMQLQKINNIPKRDGEIDMKLLQGDEEIARLDKECTPCGLKSMNENNCNLTFSFPMYQDSIDSLNLISDRPILIQLIERIRHSASYEMEESPYEEIIPIGQGYIDILGYLQKKRFSVNVEAFIYPVNKNDNITSGTTKTVFQIYTLLPMLKNIDFTNVIFIIFESLYNCTEDILDDPEDLRADMVFRMTNASGRGREEIIEICSFTGFKKKIIAHQDPNIIWESARDAEQRTGVSFGFHTDNKLKIHKLFKHILRPEGKPLDFRAIDIERDEALVCNGMHRFVLTEQLRSILEEAFTFRLQGLALRIYRKGAPDEILLEGNIEPSVFLYPFVNAVRFAVVLQPPQKSQIKRRKSKKGSLASDMNRPPCFAIISICLLTPITEEGEPISSSNHPMAEKIRFCKRKTSEMKIAPSEVLKERAYDSFDDWVSEVVDYIVKNNIREVTDAKNFFCCQSQNAGNRILELIALDFNKRFPTKDNIEFCNLMTTVYKELEERIYRIIETCGQKQLKDCRLNDEFVQEHIIALMNNKKLGNELDDEILGDLVMDELNENYSNNTDLNFYMFLENVENGNFKSAKSYIAKPPKERRLRDEYFTRILEVYIKYMEDLQNEEIYNEAFERLLCNLNEFVKNFPKDFDFWILLYCMYKTSEYLPGMEFARWHFEDLDPKSRRMLKAIPTPRWNFYLNYDIVFQSQRDQEFYRTVKMFQSIGAYKFAEMVFDHIAGECMDIERYLQKTTLQILLKEVPSNSRPEKFGDLTSELETMLENVNGHLLFASDDINLAIENYENLAELLEDTGEEIEPYKLGIRRYANYMMSNNKYRRALKALAMLDKDSKSASVSITMGKANYKLGLLKEALECFKESTEHAIFIPDVWGYLALIHLKLGENYKALECWKYAKHKASSFLLKVPNVVISKEIINELNKINVDEVDLYVSRPY